MTRALILRHIDYGESDRIITVFSRDMGRIVGIARGVRRSTRRFSGRLDLFGEIELKFHSGRGELLVFDSAELLCSHLNVRDSLATISWASYFCELAERLFGVGEAHPEAFDLLAFALSYLSQKRGKREEVLRALEFRLLTEAGLQPQLEVCIQCHRTVALDEPLLFVTTRGGVVCQRCGAVDIGKPIPRDVQHLLHDLPHQDVATLGHIQLSPAGLVATREIMAAFIRYHLGAALRTVDLLASVCDDLE